MKNEERVSKLQGEEYQEIFGATKRTFEEMLKVLEADCGQKHQKGGSLPKLSVLDKLIIMLQYYREYRAMRHIAFDYGVVKSTISDTVAWAERTLIRSGLFRLPSKKKQMETESSIEMAIADARTRDVICSSTAAGRKHDFTLLKDSCVHFSPKTEGPADKGYQGIANLHENRTAPVKASKNHRLTAEERNNNASISRRRIYIEHINRYMKRFRILSSRYRNNRKKFRLRASLICGIFNF